MLETLPGGTEPTNSSAASFSLFAFVPRQVTLAKRQNMKNKDLSETLENGGFVEGDSVKKSKSKKNKKKNKGRDQTPLVLSIAAYLKHRGFTETFAALQSEASVGQLDDSEVHELEKIFFQYLDSSKCDTRSTDNAPEELDVLIQEESKSGALVEHSVKSKKKKTDCTDGKVHETSTDNGATEPHLDESDKKPKDKKRKKSKSITVVNGGSETCSAIEKDTKELVPVEDNSVSKDKKSSKKRKRVISEENASQPDGDEKKTTEALVEDTEKTEGEHASKKTKTVCDQTDFLSEGEKTPKADFLANGDLEKSGKENTGPLKSKKKQQNGSAEPKTVNAFQRVKVEEVKFADDRLQDNSYWAKGGAEIGYGAKAQEVLGQVRGRDFRHEKTKKKRGSYRGGQIDLQTHSVKFNYSDEE